MHQGIELRHLRYFIAVAEEQHFSRAAGKLFLAAPSLSKQIRQLEEALGFSLFERKTRNVNLTPAGIAFAAQLRIAFGELERAVELGLATNRRNAGIFSVGYSPWLDPSILKPVGNAISDQQTGIRVEFHSAYSINQIPQIRSGQLDAGIVLLPVDAEGLCVEGVRTDTMTLALPQGHRFVEQTELKFSDVGQEPLIWVGRSVHPALGERLLESCLRLGLRPNIVHDVTTVQEALHLVASGAGLSFVRSGPERAFHMKGVAFRRPTGGSLDIEIAVAYQPEHDPHSVQALISALKANSTSVTAGAN